MIEKVTNAAVLGAGVSGVAAARALKSLGIRVTVFDEAPKDLDEFETVAPWNGRLPEGKYDLVVTSPGFPREHTALSQAMRSGIPIWSEPELAYRIAKSPIIAVTGTNGKSTTTYMIYRMLVEAGYAARLCGNIAGSGEDQPFCAAALGAGPNDVLVAEVSSFQLEWVDRFHPRIAVLTRIDQDHLNRYGGDFEEYARTKRRIFAQQTGDDWAVIGHASVPHVAAKRVDIYRETDGHCAFFRGEAMILRLDGQEHLLAETSDIRTRSLADQENALGAATAAWLYGAHTEAIRAALQNFRGLGSRMEVVGQARGITFIDNSAATNPSSCANAIRSAGPKTTALIGGVAKGNDPTPIVEACKLLARPAVLYGEMAPALAGMMTAAGVSHIVVETLEEAFSVAVAQSSHEDIVLLAPGGASFDQFPNFLARARRFRELVAELGADQS